MYDVDVNWSLKVQTLCCMVFSRVHWSFLFTAAAAAAAATTTPTTITNNDDDKRIIKEAKI